MFDSLTLMLLISLQSFEEQKEERDKLAWVLEDPLHRGMNQHEKTLETLVKLVSKKESVKPPKQQGQAHLWVANPPKNDVTQDDDPKDNRPKLEPRPKVEPRPKTEPRPVPEEPKQQPIPQPLPVNPDFCVPEDNENEEEESGLVTITNLTRFL